MMFRPSTCIAVAIAAIIIAILVAIAAYNWIGIGDVGISFGGWIALVLGVLATLAVGVGLMALMFISNRRGYDEPPHERD
jgi:hypothetical protein